MNLIDEGKVKELKGSIVQATWVDISSKGGWLEADEVKEFLDTSSPIYVTYGVLLGTAVDGSLVITSTNKFEYDPSYEYNCGDVTKIPRCCLLTINELRTAQHGSLPPTGELIGDLPYE